MQQVTPTKGSTPSKENIGTLPITPLANAFHGMLNRSSGLKEVPFNMFINSPAKRKSEAIEKLNVPVVRTSAVVVFPLLILPKHIRVLVYAEAPNTPLPKVPNA